jgi:hypothetical protein
VFFLLATELATEMGFTEDCYTDGHVPSVMPSVIISPTDFIPVTNGRSPSVKLFNGVVNPNGLCSRVFKEIYFHTTKFLKAKGDSIHYWIWQSKLVGKEVLHQFGNLIFYFYFFYVFLLF